LTRTKLHDYQVNGYLVGCPLRGKTSGGFLVKRALFELPASRVVVLTGESLTAVEFRARKVGRLIEQRRRRAGR
jgi:hypothetical protein